MPIVSLVISVKPGGYGIYKKCIGFVAFYPAFKCQKLTGGCLAGELFDGKVQEVF